MPGVRHEERIHKLPEGAEIIHPDAGVVARRIRHKDNVALPAHIRRLKLMCTTAEEYRGLHEGADIAGGGPAGVESTCFVCEKGNELTTCPFCLLPHHRSCVARLGSLSRIPKLGVNILQLPGVFKSTLLCGLCQTGLAAGSASSSDQ